MIKKGLFLLLIPFFIYSGPKEDSKKLYDEGVKLYKEGKVDESINVLRESVKLDNTNFWAKKQLAEILAVKGEELYNKGYQKTAYELFREGFRYFPNHQGIVYWINKLKPMEDKLKDNPVSEKKEVKEDNTSDIVKEEKKENKEANETKETKVFTPDKNLDIQKDIQKMEERFNERMIKLIEAMNKSKVVIPQITTPNITINKEEIKEDIKKDIKKEISNKDVKKDDQNFFYLLITLIISVIFLIFVVLLYFFYRKSHKKIKLKVFNSANSHYFQELTKLYKIEELLEKIEKKDINWEALQKYIGELDKKIKFEILYLIENKITRDNNPLNNSILETLTCLISDPDEYLQTRAKYILNQSLQTVYIDKMLESPKSNNRLALSSSINQKVKTDKEKDIIDSEIVDLKIAMPLAKIIDNKLFKQKHSQNVGKGVYYVAQEIGIDPSELELYYVAGLLHDIGYFDILSSLISKRGKLNEDEANLIKSHPQKGIELLEFATIPSVIYDGILYHHKRIDGSGYPNGLKGDEIPLVAKIIAVVDAFEAMTSPRPYRPPLSCNESLMKIREGKGVIFDINVVDAFERVYRMGLIEKEESRVIINQ